MREGVGHGTFARFEDLLNGMTVLNALSPCQFFRLETAEIPAVNRKITT